MPISALMKNFTLIALMLALPLSWSAPTDPVDLAITRVNMACFYKMDTTNADRTNHNTKLTGASTNQQEVVEQVLDRVSRVGGEAFTKSLNIDFKTSTTASASCAGSTDNRVITLTACTEGDPDKLAKQLVSQIAKVAGSGFYQSYQQSMRNKCKAISKAAASSRKEEFHEVFISYLTSPNALHTLCPAQYEWLHKNVFRNSDADPREGCPAHPAPPAPEPRRPPAAQITPPVEPPAARPPDPNGSFSKGVRDLTPVMTKLFELYNLPPKARISTPEQPFSPFPQTLNSIPTTPPALPVRPTTPFPENTNK